MHSLFALRVSAYVGGLMTEGTALDLVFADGGPKQAFDPLAATLGGPSSVIPKKIIDAANVLLN